MIYRIKIILFWLILLNNTVQGASLERDVKEQSPAQEGEWAQKVGKALADIQEVTKEAQETLTESSTLFKQAWAYLDQHKMLGPYQYLFKPSDYEGDIGELVWKGHSLHNLAGMTKLAIKMDESKKYINNFEKNLNSELRDFILNDKNTDTDKNEFLRNFCKRALQPLFLNVSFERDTFAVLDKHKHFSLISEVRRQGVNTPVLHYFSTQGRQPRDLNIPPILQARAVHNKILREVSLRILRLLSKLYTDEEIPLIPASVVLMKQNGQQTELDTVSWSNYVLQLNEPELTADELQPSSWYREYDDLYTDIVRLQNEYFAGLFKSIQKENGNLARTIEMKKAQRAKGQHVPPVVENEAPEDPKALEALLDQFSDEEDSLNTAKAKKNKKKPAKGKSLELSQKQREQQAAKSQKKQAAQARKNRELDEALEAVALSAAELPAGVEPGAGNRTKEVPQREAKRSERPDLKKSNGVRSRERQVRQGKASLYVENFAANNFADLPALSKECLRFFEDLYDPKTNLIKYDQLLKCSRDAGIKVENRSGSLRIFSWQDKFTRLNLVKRFDEPHVKNNNERNYSSYVIGIARDFFSALRPTSQHRISGIAQEVIDEEYFLSNLKRFIQEP